MFENHFISAIIPAAGLGLRFNNEVQKIYVHINGKPLLWYVLNCFNSDKLIDEIVLMVHESMLSAANDIIKENNFEKITFIETGGATRTETVKKALQHIDDSSEIVVIHDGARPLVSHHLILNSIRTACAEGGAICAIRPKNTIKLSDQFGFVQETLNRDRLYEVQTPQSFKRNLIENCYNVCQLENTAFTDDSAVIENCGYRVKIVEGDYRNIKITTNEDAKIVEYLLKTTEDTENKIK